MTLYLYVHTATAFQAVLGTRDLLVRIRIPGSVPLTNGSGSGSGSTPDPTYFFIDFKDVKNKFFFILFLIICQQAHHIQSQSAQHIYAKREGSGSVPLTNGSGSGRSKNMKIMRIRIWFRIQIPNTVVRGVQNVTVYRIRT
jgi:hypothetical protein